MTALLLLKEKIDELRDELASDVLYQATPIIREVGGQLEPCIP